MNSFLTHSKSYVSNFVKILTSGCIKKHLLVVCYTATYPIKGIDQAYLLEFFGEKTKKAGNQFLHIHNHLAKIFPYSYMYKHKKAYDGSSSQDTSLVKGY